MRLLLIIPFAVVAASGYIKSQSYIPLTLSRQVNRKRILQANTHVFWRSAHFIDPSLRAILESALTPDDNDLFLSNLVDTPVLAVHGFVYRTWVYPLSN